MNDKNLWNQLAKRNWKFYIYTGKGRDISDPDFLQTGEEDYDRLVVKDSIIKTKFPDRSNLSALEIGCGAGRILRPMARDFGRVVGIDVSGEMLSHARNRVDAELIETNGSEIPVEDNSIDFVFSYLVFQHLKSYILVEDNFREVKRILKDGGLFKVLMRSENSKKEWGRAKMSWWDGVYYKPYMMEHLVKRSKFKLLKQEPTGDGRMWLWLEK